MNILITGANGFIGKHLSKYLEKNSFNITRVIRNKSEDQKNIINITEINENTDWGEILLNIDVVIHLANTAHKPDDLSLQEEKEFMNKNFHGTINLANQCVRNNVKKFIYLSSVKVIGEKTINGNKFDELTKTNPQDLYGRSKLKIEKQLLKISKASNLIVVIIRPPLIYGPGVKGNFLKLLNLVDTSLPLPFSSFKNKRSLLFIGNLIDFIKKLLNEEYSLSHIFMISDDNEISLTELISIMSKFLNRRDSQFSIPKFFLKVGLKIIGKENKFSKLSDSLEIDISKTKKLLNWKPKYNQMQGLKVTCDWYASFNE